MMDRTGSYAVVFALVLLSALHIVSAPVYLNAVPALLLVFGILRLVMVRSAGETSATEDLSLSPAVEA